METDDPTLVGENCHIIAEREDGPRGDPNVSPEQRNRYENLVLLCSIHHKIIDDNADAWTIEKIKLFKQEHEIWVESSLGLDKIKLRHDSIYASYIEEWERLAHIDSWLGWSSYILSASGPRIRAEIEGDLGKLRRWLLARIWPGRYPRLEAAFENFRWILNDFHEILLTHLESRFDGTVLSTEKFYKIREWDPERYNYLLKRYEFHVEIVGDLMLELTRAANLLCDEIREHIAHNYRMSEGNLIVQRGPDMNLCFVERVVRYKSEEIQENSLYAGLGRFYRDRDGRDWSIGNGDPPP